MPRVLRVFVSSTFRDMVGERDELVKRVFPQLRRLCEQRGVVWGEVDLRWGITDEQAAEGRVLPVCLEEIDRCRPFFLGMLGDRYGSVADDVPADLLAREPWLADHTGESITALEVVHGVLRDPETAAHACFYFRDPAFTATLPPDLQDGFRESSAEAADRLIALKDRIRRSSARVREAYSDPEEFGTLVLADLTDLIDRFFPQGSEPDAVEREAAAHRTFAARRSQAHVPDPAAFALLDRHAGGDGPPLVVVGEPGSGKSALLAAWLSRREAAGESVLSHYVGASPRSSDWVAMLRRLMQEMGRRFGVDLRIPEDPEVLRLSFADYLDAVAADHRLILVIDGLDHLADARGVSDLTWLPERIPEAVRLVLSTGPGAVVAAVRRRGWPVSEMPGLGPGLRAGFVNAYLAEYSKALDPDRVERIAGAPQTANPLFLRTVLDELRVVGEHERLDDQIGQYLAAASPTGLYDRVLARYEEDYERGRPGLVGEVMRLLWAARRGLSEAEIRQMVGDDGLPLPSAVWVPLYLALESAVEDRDGLLALGEGPMRTAVRDRYLPRSERPAAHLRIADALEGSRLTLRGLDEMPWQLAEAGEWDRLAALVGDPEFLEFAWSEDHLAVVETWSRMERESPVAMTDTYSPVIADPGAYPIGFVVAVAALLGGTSHPYQGLSLHHYLVEHRRAGGDREALAGALFTRAADLWGVGDRDAAMADLEEAEGISRDIGERFWLQAVLGLKAVVLEARDDLGGAMACHRERVSICRELGDRRGVAESMGNQALILERVGDLQGALDLYRSAEGWIRELGSPGQLAAFLGNQGRLSMVLGDVDRALALEEEAEQILRRVGDAYGLAFSLNRMGGILRERGDPAGALARYRESERVAREVDNREALAVSLGNQSNLLRDLGDIGGAERLTVEVERLARALGDRDLLQQTLGSQALILEARGDVEGALEKQAEQEQMCREAGFTESLITSLANQAVLMTKYLGRAADALPLAEEAHRLAVGHGFAALAPWVESVLKVVRRRAAQG